jgi:secreted trypsin-like serine protease
MTIFYRISTNEKSNLIILMFLILLGCGPKTPEINGEKGIQTKEQVEQNQFLFEEQPQPEIIGGEPVYDIKTIPWQVALLEPTRDINCYCGGSAINQEWIITAAHCLYKEDFFGNVVKRNLNEIYVFANSSNFNSGGEIYDVIQIIEHPNYDDKTLDNDIAVLKLSQPITQVAQNQFITAPDINEYREFRKLGNELDISGWGYTNSNGNGTDILMSATVFSKSQDICVDNYKVINDVITDNMLCASGIFTDTCFGDSGGPLFTYIGNRGVLMGITSKGPPGECGDDKLFGVYTNVFNYFDWINNQCGDCFKVSQSI